MLVALLILSLAVGGVMQATALLGRFQSDAQLRVSHFEARRRLQLAFSAVLDGQGPFRSSSKAFEGDADGFQFGCGNALCGARLLGECLELNGPAPSNIDLGRGFAGRFEYVGRSTTEDSWPSRGPAEQRLLAVELIGDGPQPAPIALARVWRQEEEGCRFDAIAKDCRGPGA